MKEKMPEEYVEKLSIAIFLLLISILINLVLLIYIFRELFYR